MSAITQSIYKGLTDCCLKTNYKDKCSIVTLFVLGLLSITVGILSIAQAPSFLTTDVANGWGALAGGVILWTGCVVITVQALSEKKLPHENTFRSRF